MIGEQRDVFRAVLELWDVNRNDPQAVIEIFAQPARLDRFFRVTIRRSDEAHVDDGIGCLAADAANDTVLNYAQQLRLCRLGHLEQLIQKECAAVGTLQQAGFVAHGAGERALHVAEHLRFEQRFGQRGAVQRDQRVAAAPAVRVDELCNQLLARAALTRDEHRRVRGGHAAREIDRPAEYRRNAQHLDPITVAVLLRELGLLLLRFLRDADGMHRAADENLEMRDRKSTRLNSSHVAISYAVFCLKKTKKLERETTRKNAIGSPLAAQ